MVTDFLEIVDIETPEDSGVFLCLLLCNFYVLFDMAKQSTMPHLITPAD